MAIQIPVGRLCVPWALGPLTIEYGNSRFQVTDSHGERHRALAVGVLHNISREKFTRILQENRLVVAHGYSIRLEEQNVNCWTMLGNRVVTIFCAGLVCRLAYQTEESYRRTMICAISLGLIGWTIFKPFPACSSSYED